MKKILYDHRLVCQFHSTPMTKIRHGILDGVQLSDTILSKLATPLERVSDEQSFRTSSLPSRFNLLH